MNTYKAWCAKCHGTGLVFKMVSTTAINYCPVCFGNGYVIKRIMIFKKPKMGKEYKVL